MGRCGLRRDEAMSDCIPCPPCFQASPWRLSPLRLGRHGDRSARHPHNVPAPVPMIAMPTAATRIRRSVTTTVPEKCGPVATRTWYTKLRARLAPTVTCFIANLEALWDNPTLRRNCFRLRNNGGTGNCLALQEHYSFAGRSPVREGFARRNYTPRNHRSFGGSTCRP
jgi:hypothetical protein